MKPVVEPAVTGAAMTTVSLTSRLHIDEPALRLDAGGSTVRNPWKNKLAGVVAAVGLFLLQGLAIAWVFVRYSGPR